MSITNNSTLKTIGLFNDSFPPIMDGVSLTVQNYAYWLNKKNHPVCVVTPHSPKHSDNEAYPILRYNSIPILGRKPYRFGLPTMDMSFKTELKQLSFGLVHAHCPFSSGNIALKIARKQQIPFIATFHSKYRDDFERSVRNKYLAKLMTKQVIRFFEKADQVWIPQASVEDTIREYGFKGKVEVVDNGNDFASNLPVEPVKKQARIALNIQTNEPVLLFVGQHIWEKNTRLIIESLAMINDLPFKVFFIGTGYAKDDLMQLAEKLNLGSKVEFIGVITDRDQIKQYYAAANLFLFPSIYDNAPLVIREAAALQTPSVLVKDSSSAENIIDNFNGFLTEDSPEAFSSRLRGLLQSPEKISSVGVDAAKTLARSWESVTEEVFDRYKILMSKTWRR